MTSIHPALIDLLFSILNNKSMQNNFQNHGLKKNLRHNCYQDVFKKKKSRKIEKVEIVNVDNVSWIDLACDQQFKNGEFEQALRRYRIFFDL